MILALLWLTVSIPFVNASRQALAHQEHKALATSDTANDEQSTNPFGNTTEEKAPCGSSSLSEEYLHDHHSHDPFFVVVSQFHKCENAGTYNAFHGELLVPPPNVA